MPVEVRCDGRVRRHRTDVVQKLSDAGFAERALEGADPCFERAGRKSLVAVFAGRAKFQHC